MAKHNIAQLCAPVCSATIHKSLIGAFFGGDIAPVALKVMMSLTKILALQWFAYNTRHAIRTSVIDKADLSTFTTEIGLLAGGGRVVT